MQLPKQSISSVARVSSIDFVTNTIDFVLPQVTLYTVYSKVLCAITTYGGCVWVGGDGGAGQDYFSVR